MRTFAARTQAERGVKHASLNIITVTPGDSHGHAHDGHHHSGHQHLIPRS